MFANIPNKEPYEDALKYFNAEKTDNEGIKKETWNKFYRNGLEYQTAFLRAYKKISEGKNVVIIDGIML